jgi:YD repeat-containing protein
MISPEGTETAAYEYDDKHHVTQEIDLDGTVTTYTYIDDNHGQPSRITTDDGESIEIKEYEYIQGGNYVQKITDSDGYWQEYGYDLNSGLMLSSGDSEGNEATYTYEVATRTMKAVVGKPPMKGRVNYGAKAPKKPLERIAWSDEELAEYYNTIAIHHTQRKKNEKILDLQKACMKKYDDFEYHFAISSDGTIYEARQIAFKGAHIEGANSYKVGVALMGNFSTEEGWWQNLKDWLQGAKAAEPTTAQLNSMTALVVWLNQQLDTPTVKGHRYLTVNGNKTNCPGNLLLKTQAYKNLEKG